MDDDRGTKEHLLDELEMLRTRIEELEKLRVAHGETASAVHSSEERFRKYFGLPHLGLAVIDEKGRWVEVNDKLCSMLQYSREELKNMTWQCLTPAEELNEEMTQIKPFLAGRKESYIIEKHYVRKDGTLLSVRVSAAQVRRKDGDIDYSVAIIEDIGARVRLEEELKVKNMLLFIQQEVSLDGILIVGEKGDLLFFNRRFRDMWNLPSEICDAGEDAPILQAVADKVRDRDAFLKRVHHLYTHRDETSRDEVALKDGRTFDRYSSPMVGPDGVYYGRIWYFRDMTKRTRAEEALRDSERRYREFADSLPQVVLEMDAGGAITFLNKNGFLMSGYTPEDLKKGLNVLDLVVPEDRERLTANMEMVKHGIRLTGEYRMVKKDGRTFPVVMDSNPVVRSGVAEAFRAVVMDISDRKRVEEALRKSEEKYRELVENANSIILRMTNQGIITFINEFAQRFFGYTEEEIVGRNVVGTIVPPHDSTGADLTRLVDEIVENPETHPTNVNENIRRTGERVWIAWTNKPVYDEEGRLASILCIGNDITEQKKATEALEEREGILKAIINGSPVAQFVIDRNHRIIYWSRAMSELTGAEGEKMIGTDAHRRLLYQQERPCLADLVLDEKGAEIPGWYPSGAGKSGLIEGVYEATELIRLRDREEKWLHLTAAQIRDSKGRLIGATETLEDITERTLAIETLRKRERDLEEKSVNLGEAYTALKVLLQHKEEDKEVLENSVLANVRELVLPYIDKLENTRPSETQKVYINILKSNLNDIVSPFLQKMSAIASQLTPTELQVAALIKAGRSSKEIAEALNIGTGTVETHRKSIRGKLGLNRKKVNLHSYLASLK